MDADVEVGYENFAAWLASKSHAINNSLLFSAISVEFLDSPLVSVW